MTSGGPRLERDLSKAPTSFFKVTLALNGRSVSFYL